MGKYSDYMDFSNSNSFAGISNADNLEDISKSLNDGSAYKMNAINTGIDTSQFSFNLGDNPTTNKTFMQGMLGDKNTNGWGGTALNVLQSGLGFYLGSQQLKQAEKSLALDRDNYNAQKTLINDQLKWQYQARKNGNPNYEGELAQIS